MVQLLIYTYMKRKHLCKSSILFTFERVNILKKLSIALHIHSTALVAQTVPVIYKNHNPAPEELKKG